MSTGIDVFSRHFANYKEQYVVIGGTACEMLLSEEALDFRLTRDIDMVLIVEALTSDFAAAFWEFIDKGGYEPWTRKDGEPKFYRFVKPTAPGYPYMIELFARPGNGVDFEYHGHLMPLHIDDDISSLSAILLNDDYYRFLVEGRNMSGDITVLDVVHIIPLKMRAWIDLTRQKNEGLHVNERDIRKHRLDVFRLFPLVNADARVAVSPLIYDDIQHFISEMRSSEFDLKAIHIPIEKDSILEIYDSIYYKKTEE